MSREVILDRARALDAERFCYLETVGRVSGRPHEVEMWFAVGADNHIYLLSGGRGRSDWVKNVRHNPAVRVRVGGVYYQGAARVIDDSTNDLSARRLLAAKYQGWRADAPLSEWARTSLPVAILLDFKDA
jgi:deazaflavin-dependent oxidoreductase (nitroreductase family)